MKVAFVGNHGLGGVKMRGVSVAELMGVPFYDLSDIPDERFDTIVLVKYWFLKSNYAERIRNACDRLIFDPLDCWESTKKGKLEPPQFWEWTIQQIPFDEIVATSIGCAASMSRLGCPIHIAPHHADPRIGPDWYNASGPVVYAGGMRFIETAIPDIQHACNNLGRRLLVDYKRDCWERLKGSSLCLHLRLPPTDFGMNRHCKPQVKLENAAAAGLPCLATDHPCVRGLHSTEVLLHGDDPDWVKLIREGLESPRLTNPVTLDNHCKRMAEIIGC